MVVAAYNPDAEIARLTAEKQRKYRELEKCAKSVSGLQIAGVSTIGLTAAGVALNMSQANQKQTLDGQIKATNTQIKNKKQELEEKRIRAEQEKIAAEKLAQARTECEADPTKTFVNGACVDGTDTQSTTPDSNYATADNTVDVNSAQESQAACLARAQEHPGTECYTDSNNEWKIRWTVSEGDPCPISECFDQINAETCKYTWVPDSFVCVANTCNKSDYKVSGHICQKEAAITCDETRGEIVSASGDECIKCSTGHIAQDGKCVECPHDKKPNGNRCDDYTCGPSEFKTWGECTQCLKNNIVVDNHCVACPSTQRAENNRCVEFSCPSDSFKSSGECVKCTTDSFRNWVPNADQSGCEASRSDEALSLFRNACGSVGGIVGADGTCALSLSVTEYSEISEKCRTIGDMVGVNIGIGRTDTGRAYCEM